MDANQSVRKKVLEALETSENPLTLGEIKELVPEAEEGIAKVLSDLRSSGEVVSRMDHGARRLVWGLQLE